MRRSRLELRFSNETHAASFVLLRPLFERRIPALCTVERRQRNSDLRLLFHLSPSLSQSSSSTDHLVVIFSTTGQFRFFDSYYVSFALAWWSLEEQKIWRSVSNDPTGARSVTCMVRRALKEKRKRRKKIAKRKQEERRRGASTRHQSSSTIDHHLLLSRCCCLLCCPLLLLRQREKVENKNKTANSQRREARTADDKNTQATIHSFFAS